MKIYRVAVIGLGGMGHNHALAVQADDRCQLVGGAEIDPERAHVWKERFDVEVVFLLPWAVVLKELGLLALIEMGIFLIILIIGLAYVWVKADLDWVKRRVIYGTGRYKDMHMKEAN